MLVLLPDGFCDKGRLASVQVSRPNFTGTVDILRSIDRIKHQINSFQPSNGNGSSKDAKAKKKRKRKKVKPDGHEDECYRCSEGGELVMCDKAQCPKAYHLSCLGLEKMPHGELIFSCYIFEMTLKNVRYPSNRSSNFSLSYFSSHIDGMVFWKLFTMILDDCPRNRLTFRFRSVDRVQRRFD